MGVGKDGRDGDEGPAGKDGEDGVGVTGVTLGIDDSLIFQLSNGDEASVELPLTENSGNTVINKIGGGGGGSGSSGQGGQGPQGPQGPAGKMGDVDGGRADSVYTGDQVISGGSA